MSSKASTTASAWITNNAVRVADQIEAGSPTSNLRKLISIAGAPGSGKSSLAEAVVAMLAARGHDVALMPMDGFHLDDRLLEPRDLLPRKGAPETFDFGGLATALQRVRTETSVILPVFDRTREIAIAGAVEIHQSTQIVVVEGNYLSLDEAPWRNLAPLWDMSIFLDVPLPELEQRLINRWLSHGYDLQAATTKTKNNDMCNAARVINAVLPVDLVIHI